MDDAFLLRTVRLLVLPLVLAFLFRHSSPNPTMVKPEDVPRVKLNNGNEIPIIGLGMLPMRNCSAVATSDLALQEHGRRRRIKAPSLLNTL